jgi:hypothetical protein
MECAEVRTFLSQISSRTEPTPIPLGDLGYLCDNGYLVSTTTDDHDRAVVEVARLSQLTAQEDAEKESAAQAADALEQDEQKADSFSSHLEGSSERDALRQKIQDEMTTASGEGTQLSALEENVNALIMEKSTTDRMVAYGGGYLSLTDLGSVVLNDLNVRNYRVSDEQFSDFVTEIRSTYSELRSIADRATSYVGVLKSAPGGAEDWDDDADDSDQQHQVQALLWSTAIGLGKLQGDTSQIAERVAQALYILVSFKSLPPNKLMAAEVMTALNRDPIDLATDLMNLDAQVRDQGVPKETSVGIAATLLAARRYDGNYPLDDFIEFHKATKSVAAASVLAVMNVPYADMSAKFQSFRDLFKSWGYTMSEDTEIASAFLAIGELEVGEVKDKMQYIVEQLKNYLEYPLIPAAVLASIPVFEAHEVLDLMEKAVTMLTGYLTGFERSEVVALAVRLIHGVRNEIVKQIDPTATVAETPIQFTYGSSPGLLRWYFPVVVVHSSYTSAFSGMGAFHPAHAHGLGGFAG